MVLHGKQSAGAAVHQGKGCQCSESYSEQEGQQVWHVLTLIGQQGAA